MNKPRFLPLTAAERAELVPRIGEIDVPRLVASGMDVYAPADELRAWRASQNAKAAKP